MKKIRVLQLLYSVEAAGAEKVALLISKYIDRTLFEPVVCSLRSGKLLEEFTSLHIPVHILNKKRGLDLKTIWRLQKIIRSERVDIIHSHNFSPNLWGRVSGYISRVPVLITTEHTMASSKKRVQRIIDYILSVITDEIISVSDRVRNSVIKNENIKGDKITTIYNGIEPWKSGEDDLSTFRNQLHTQFNIARDSNILTTVGRLEPPKGYEYLINAIPMIQKKHPKTIFFIVGEGYLKHSLEKLADTLGIRERIIFTGFRSDVKKILAVSDLCIIPSLREGFSVTLLEAMSVGLPIIATDVGGNAEAIIDGESGCIIKPSDSETLAHSILDMLEDRAKAEEYGINAKKRFEYKFTVNKMIDKTEQLYKSLYYGNMQQK